MSQSLLHNVFGVGPDWRYTRTEYAEGAVLFHVRGDKERPCGCVECQSKRVIGNGVRQRRIRTVPIGCKPVWIVAECQRYRCQDCGASWQDSPPFVDEKAKVCSKLRNYVIGLARFMTLKDVAMHCGLSWDTVKEIVKARLEKEYRRVPLKRIRRLCIDEIYVGRSAKFMTLVMDADSGRILWVGQGKGGPALREFWRRTKCAQARIEAVCMDMSAAYARSVREHIPHAVIVFDHFHVIKLMNEKLDDLRRELVREVETEDSKRAIKGTRWLLLRRRDNLPADRKGELEEALKLNEPLACAYLLKEELSLAWQEESQPSMVDYLEAWCEKAIASGISQLVAMAGTLCRYAEGIIAWATTRLSNGRMEGINRKIKTFLRQAYGLRDPEFFRLRLLSLHEAKHQLVG